LNRNSFTPSAVWDTFSRACSRALSATNVRLTLLFSAIFLVGAVALFTISFFSLTNSLRQDDVQEMHARLLGYWAMYQRSGVEAVREEIEERPLPVGERAFFVRLADEDNRTIAVQIPPLWRQGFRIGRLEGTEPATTADGVVVLESELLPYTLEVTGIRLSDEHYLQVGLSTQHRDQLLELFQRNFVIISAAVVIVSVFGGLFLASRTLKPVQDLSDTIRSILQTGDFSSRIPVNQSLFRSKGDLDQLVVYFNEMLGRIERLVGGMHDALDTVAHDLRTPMTRLRGAAELALQTGGDEETYREALSTCIDESDVMLRMLNTLMDITEAQSGAVKLDLEEMDAAQAARNMCDMYSYVAETRDVKLRTEIVRSGSFPVDAVRLRQALGNVLDNAVKYSREGGNVTMVVNVDQDWAEFRIQDDGIGISEEDMPRIWTRLYRGTQAKGSPGLGLGLSLVRAIVEAHRGSVDIHSTPGQGTEVTIAFPRRRNEG